MTREERMEIARRFLDEYCLPTMESKGKDYDDGKDSNSNFTETELPSRGVDKYVTWWVYTAKQFFAIRSWIVTRKLFSEPLESRIRDVIVFCLILVGMLYEDGEIGDGKTGGRRKHPEDWIPMCYRTWKEHSYACERCFRGHDCKLATEGK